MEFVFVFGDGVFIGVERKVYAKRFAVDAHLRNGVSAEVVSVGVPGHIALHLAVGEQFVFNFAPESLLTPYEIWKEVYEKEAFDNFKNQEKNKRDEKGAAFICVHIEIYHSITMDSHSPGIFYDSNFLEGKAYTPHE